MLIRLLLALTIALLPMPAAADCHAAAPAPMAHHEGMDHSPARPAPAKQVPAEQLCIGCVAPATARTPAVAPPPAYARVESRPGVVAGIALGNAPPATPPPRSEA